MKTHVYDCPLFNKNAENSFLCICPKKEDTIQKTKYAICGCGYVHSSGERCGPW